MLTLKQYEDKVKSCKKKITCPVCKEILLVKSWTKHPCCDRKMCTCPWCFGTVAFQFGEKQKYLPHLNFCFSQFITKNAWPSKKAAVTTTAAAAAAAAAQPTQPGEKVCVEKNKDELYTNKEELYTNNEELYTNKEELYTNNEELYTNNDEDDLAKNEALVKDTSTFVQRIQEDWVALSHRQQTFLFALEKLKNKRNDGYERQLKFQKAQLETARKLLAEKDKQIELVKEQVFWKEKIIELKDAELKFASEMLTLTEDELVIRYKSPLSCKCNCES